MAIKPDASYPGRIVAATADYPLGSAQNETASGADDGTPAESAWINDLWGFLQSLLIQDNLTATGNADTALLSQYREAVVNQNAWGDYYETYGGADAIILNSRNAVNGAICPTGQFLGLRARFKALADNTLTTTTLTLADNNTTIGPFPLSTVQVANGGTPAISAGMIGADQIITVVYDETPDGITPYWRIVGDPMRLDSGDNSAAVIPRGFFGFEAGGAVFTLLQTYMRGRGISYTGGPGDVDAENIRKSIFDASAAWGTWTVDPDTSNIYTNTSDLVLTGIPFSATKRSMVAFLRFYVSPKSFICPAYCSFKDNGAGVLTVDSVAVLSVQSPTAATDHELVIEYDATGVD